MKNQFIISRIYRVSVLSLLVAALGSSMSCMTTYDAAGHPVQSVDPGLAVAGVAAAGLVGYALANDNHGNYHGNYHGKHHGGHGGYYGRPHRGHRRY